MLSSKTARWLDLIAFLLDHRFPVTREQIFWKVGGYLPDVPAGATPSDLQKESA